VVDPNSTRSSSPSAAILQARYRDWPESGLYKYHDVKEALGDVIRASDFFIFMDADCGFNEDTGIMDVGADLFVVEHPMYPRDDLGWCEKATGQAMCGFPYDRNPRSHAYIPPEEGTFLRRPNHVCMHVSQPRWVHVCMHVSQPWWVQVRMHVSQPWWAQVCMRLSQPLWAGGCRCAYMYHTAYVGCICNSFVQSNSTEINQPHTQLPIL
jgi:hypothetical protein